MLIWRGSSFDLPHSDNPCRQEEPRLCCVETLFSTHESKGSEKVRRHATIATISCCRIVLVRQTYLHFKYI